MTDKDVIDPQSAKGRLVKEAASLFKQKGYAATTVREIANEVGILSGSLFHHFPNKEAILVAVMEQAIIRTQRKQEACIADISSLKPRLVAMIQCELEAILGKSEIGFAILATEWRALSPVSQAKILGLREDYEALWCAQLSLAHDSGTARIAPYLLRHLMRGAMIETSHWFQDGGRLSLNELSEHIYQGFFAH